MPPLPADRALKRTATCFAFACPKGTEKQPGPQLSTLCGCRLPGTTATSRVQSAVAATPGGTGARARFRGVAVGVGAGVGVGSGVGGGLETTGAAPHCVVEPAAWATESLTALRTWKSAV